MKKYFTIIVILIYLFVHTAFATDEIEITNMKFQPKADIRCMQEALVITGFSYDTPDGIYGPRTEKALKTWANKYGVALSEKSAIDIAVEIFGTLDDYTQIDIYNNNGAIYVIQYLLSNYGFYNEHIDGFFGKETMKSFNKFMRATSADFGIYTESKMQIEPVVSSINMPIIHDVLFSDYDQYIEENTITPSWMKFLVKSYNPIEPFDITASGRKEDIERLQKRLVCLGYLNKSIDGNFDQSTIDALNNFQRDNNHPVSNRCTIEDQELLFSKNAKYAKNPVKPIHIKVSTTENTVYVYGWSGSGYNHPIKKFICSCGTIKHPTIQGTFYGIGPETEWYFMADSDVWVRYPYRITGPYFFHSILFENKGDITPTEASKNNLGINASHGCIRLTVDDARWIYENIPPGTKIMIN